MSRNDYGSGTIRERSPGHWQVIFDAGRDQKTGRRIRRSFSVNGTRRRAQEELRKALQERDNGVAVPRDKVTLVEWLPSWLARRQSGEDGDPLRPKAYERSQGIIYKHLIPALGGFRLQDLRSDHIADWKARWLSGQDSTADRPLSGASVHKHLVTLGAALKQAVKHKIITSSPMEGVDSPSVKPKTERRALTEDEIRLLLVAAQAARYNVPIRFTIATALREGELLGLRWEDVDLETGTIQIKQALSYVGGKASFQEPKTDRSKRTIELSTATIQMLRAHRLAQTEHRLKLGAIWRDHGVVFPSLVGTPWLARDFLKGYRALVGKSGIENSDTVNVHTLRHTAASQWIKYGVDIFTVSRRLGHNSAAFTMNVYGHLLKGQQRQAAEALDHLLAQAY